MEASLVQAVKGGKCLLTLYFYKMKWGDGRRCWLVCCSFHAGYYAYLCFSCISTSYVKDSQVFGELIVQDEASSLSQSLFEVDFTLVQWLSDPSPTYIWIVSWSVC